VCWLVGTERLFETSTRSTSPSEARYESKALHAPSISDVYCTEPQTIFGFNFDAIRQSVAIFTGIIPTSFIQVAAIV
jgi:hypothetical protein